jgi:hypothetical protein
MNSLQGKLFIIVLLIFIAGNSQAQEKGLFHYSSIGIQYYHGGTIGNTFKRLKDTDPVSGEIYYQHQVHANPTWNNTKRLPNWGLGLFATNSGSRRYIGTIICVYPYIKLPLFTLNWLQSDLRFAFGLGWVQKPYRQYTNPENLLLSQTISTHANVAWQNEVKLSPRHFINAGLSFYHLSNAKTSLPNLGINIPAVSIGYRYAFNGERKMPGIVSDSIHKKPFFSVLLTAGVKQMQVPDSSYYFEKLLTGELAKQLSYSSTVAAGIFISHDESVKTDPLVKHLRSPKTSQVALYASYEYNFGKISIPVQFGAFIFNSNSEIIESIGVRYHFNKNWMAQMMLKSHYYRADLMHFGVGYSFR